VKRINLITSIAIVGMTFMSLHEACATAITNRITVALTAYSQGEHITSGTSAIEIDKVDKTRITNKEILSALAAATGNAALTQSGAFIEASLPDSGTNIVVVKDKTGAVLEDVSTYISVTFGSEDIFASKFNDDNNQETSTDYFLVGFIFDDHSGKRIDVSGFATDHYTATPVKNGMQTENSTMVVSVSGNGQKDGHPAVIQGTVGLKGKDTLTTP
jgi:hypothetical protein